MTSEFEQGPELFDTPQPAVAEVQPERKGPRRIIRRKVADNPVQQRVVKVKQPEPLIAAEVVAPPVPSVHSEPAVAAVTEEPLATSTAVVPAKRGRPATQNSADNKTATQEESGERPVAARRRGRPPRSASRIEQKAVQEPVPPAQIPAAVVAAPVASDPQPAVVQSPTPAEQNEQSQTAVMANPVTQPVAAAAGPPAPSVNRPMNQNQYPRPNQQGRNQQHQQQNQRLNRQKQNHQKNGFQPRIVNKSPFPQIDDAAAEYVEDNPDAPKITVNDLSVMTMFSLRQRAIEYGLTEDFLQDLKKQEIIVEILKAHTVAGGVIFAYGSLEILPDGYGFLRSPQNNYLSGPEDIYISPSQIKLFNLKTGDTVEGQIRSPRDAERFFAMMRVQTINYDPPAVAKTRVSFDGLIPLYPDVRLNLETEDGDISTRIINLFCPIGKGQRSLIVAPPRAGKTILMQKIANAISANHPEVYLIVLLIDERPEEVTDMRRTVHGEVIASTFDEQATRHVSVAEMVIEKAKRLVEHKRDVVILLDNITRLARAYNQTVPASGKILSGGVDSNALHKPKRFLGAARNIEHGGSLTIIASALIETGSRMDEVIFEEFKGTGNNEIVLDRRMSERRLFPALNIKKSGTRREDLLLTPEEAAKIWALRNAINPMDDIEMTELLIDKMKKTKNNEAFLRSMNTASL